MPVGLDDAAAIAGLASFAISTFRGCVKAYEFLQVMQNMGKDGEGLESRLQWEQYRLTQWGVRAGLGVGKEPNPRLNWGLIVPYLNQLQEILTSVDKLRSLYHLNVSEELEDSAEAEKKGASSPPGGVGSSIAKIQPDFQKFKWRLIQINNPVVKKLRWAAGGKSKIGQIANDLAEYNTRLEVLLDWADREWLRTTQEALVRELIAQSADTTAVEEIRQLLDPTPGTSSHALQAVARLKQIRLTLRAEITNEERIPQQRVDILPLKKLSTRKLSPYTPTTPLDFEGFVLARYKMEGRYQTVLLEWREAYSNSSGPQEDPLPRLTILLRNMEDPSFHCLPCLGYLHDQSSERYGIAYRVNEPGQVGGVESSFTSLRGIMEKQDPISLNWRLKVAKDLAETVLQIHTAGWLHKAIRSDNIIFLAPKVEVQDKDQKSRTVIVGYGYARADTAQSAARYTELPDNDKGFDLYRHPSARGDDRMTYEKRFDMYSLGCVLLELALWKPLPKICGLIDGRNWDAEIRKSDIENLDLELPSLLDCEEEHEFMAAVKQAVGERFAGVICRCFVGANTKEREGGHISSLEAEKFVLEGLNGCVY